MLRSLKSYSRDDAYICRLKNCYVNKHKQQKQSTIHNAQFGPGIVWQIRPCRSRRLLEQKYDLRDDILINSEPAGAKTSALVMFLNLQGHATPDLLQAAITTESK